MNNEIKNEKQNILRIAKYFATFKYTRLIACLIYLICITTSFICLILLHLKILNGDSHSYIFLVLALIVVIHVIILPFTYKYEIKK